MLVTGLEPEDEVNLTSNLNPLEVKAVKPLTPDEVKELAIVPDLTEGAPLSRAELARRLDISGAAVTKNLQAIEGIHSVDGFFIQPGNKLTELAIVRICEYRELTREGYIAKYATKEEEIVTPEPEASPEPGKLALRTIDTSSIELPEMTPLDVDELYAKYVDTDVENADLSALIHAPETEAEIEKLWESIEAIESQNEQTDATLSEIEKREAIQRGYKKRMELLKLEALGDAKARQDAISKKSAGKQS